MGEQTQGKASRAWHTEENRILNERGPGRAEEDEDLDMIQMSCFSRSRIKAIEVTLALKFRGS